MTRTTRPETRGDRTARTQGSKLTPANRPNVVKCGEISVWLEEKTNLLATLCH